MTVNSEETTGAAISDLFREKPSSRKALQECVATGSRALMGGECEKGGGRGEANWRPTGGILFNKKKGKNISTEKARRP